MNVNPPMPGELARLAQSCLNSPGEMESLAIHEWKDDLAAHDGELQDSVRRDVEIVFMKCLDLLKKDFGEPQLTDDAAEDAIPLSGIFRAALWEVGGNSLYLAAAHEDRESPVLLMIGSV